MRGVHDRCDKYIPHFIRCGQAIIHNNNYTPYLRVGIIVVHTPSYMAYNLWAYYRGLAYYSHRNRQRADTTENIFFCS